LRRLDLNQHNNSVDGEERAGGGEQKANPGAGGPVCTVRATPFSLPVAA
jgi:hypothetical protein